MILRSCRVCGKRHNVGEWFLLECIGVQADEVDSLELRQCPCGNTLAVPITERAPVARAAIRAGHMWYAIEEPEPEVSRGE